PRLLHARVEALALELEQEGVAVQARGQGVVPGDQVAAVPAAAGGVPAAERRDRRRDHVAVDAGHARLGHLGVGGVVGGRGGHDHQGGDEGGDGGGDSRGEGAGRGAARGPGLGRPAGGGHGYRGQGGGQGQDRRAGGP